jgi:hypothetical protein
MAWKIDRDYLAQEFGTDDCPSRVGFGTKAPLEGETFTFRLLDDDGMVYYHGVADAKAAADDQLYTALNWAMADAGAVDLQVRANDAIEHGLTSRSYVESRNLNDTDWVSIYG